MPPEFQFFLLCLGVSQNASDSAIAVNGIVTGVHGSASVPTELTAVIGLFYPQEGELTLRASWLDKSLQRRPVEGTPDVRIEVPQSLGVVLTGEQIVLRTPQAGLYSVDLIDSSGLFGTSGKLLARYSFPVLIGDE